MNSEDLWAEEQLHKQYHHPSRDPRLVTPEEYEKARDYAEKEEAMKRAEYALFQKYIEEDDYLPDIDEKEFMTQEELDQMAREQLGGDYL